MLHSALKVQSGLKHSPSSNRAERTSRGHSAEASPEKGDAAEGSTALEPKITFCKTVPRVRKRPLSKLTALDVVEIKT